MKHLFYQAVEWDFFTGRNPVKGLKMLPEGFHRRALSQEQERILLAALPLHLQDLVGFSIDTGMRHGDILALQWTEIDGDVIRKVTQKRKIPVTIPLTERAVRIVRKALAGRETMVKASPFVFVNPETGEPWKDLWLGLKTVRRSVGMDEVTFHSFRHTSCTRATRRADAFTVKQLAGHADIRTTIPYVDVGMAELQKAVGLKAANDNVKPSKAANDNDGDNFGDSAPEARKQLRA